MRGRRANAHLLVMFNAWTSQRLMKFSLPVGHNCKHLKSTSVTSSETQGQIVGARESLNGRKNKARRKEKNGEKSSSHRSLLFFVPYFSARLDFPSPPLSAPGSPRMDISSPCSKSPHAHITERPRKHESKGSRSNMASDSVRSGPTNYEDSTPE